MPFIVTEPQKIDGTDLGFAVYPYHFSFDDHIDFSQGKYDQKLLIFQMKNSPFTEVEKVLHVEGFVFNEVHRGYIDCRLKEYIKSNNSHVKDADKVDKFFAPDKILEGKGGKN